MLQIIFHIKVLGGSEEIPAGHDAPSESMSFWDLPTELKV